MKHSKCSLSSYDLDFNDLIEFHTSRRNSRNDSFDTAGKEPKVGVDVCGSDETSFEEDSTDEECSDQNEDDGKFPFSPSKAQMTVEFLEDELDDCQDVDDLDGNIFMAKDFFLIK